MCRSQLRASLLQRAFAIGSELLFHLFNQGRQRGLCVRTDVEIDVGIVAEVLNVALMRYGNCGDGDGLGAVGTIDAGLRQNVGHFQVQRQVGLITLPAHAGQRMPGGEVHALLTVDGRLQQFGQFHQQRHAFRRPCHALRDDLRALGIDQHLGSLPDGGDVARGRSGLRQLGDARHRTLHWI